MTTSDVHEDEWKQPPAPEELSQGLSITFRGKTFLVQPPSARVGKQANSILGELARAEESGKDLDLERLRRKLGFADVRETSEGAAMVTAEYARLLEEGEMETIITTCCPSVNDLIEIYYPQLVPYMAPVVSPMIAHGKMDRIRYMHIHIYF